MIHPSFKINGIALGNKDVLENYITILYNASEVYQHDIASFLSDWLNDKTYVEVQTSGSTGKPKTIQLQKEHMKNSALATGAFFKLGEGIKALLCLSANYIAGKMMLVRAMTLGWEIYLVAPDSEPLKAKDDQIFDFAAMVPLQVEKSMQDLARVKQLIIGGAPVSKTLEKRIHQLQTKCYATYGMTETITHIAVKQLNHFKTLETKANFETLPNVKIALDDRGCLTIDAPKVANEIVVTNDLVKIHSKESFEWLGRFDNIINSGGVKLFPEQIEAKLFQLISQRFFVAAQADEQLGQKLILVIESKEEIAISKSEFEVIGLTRFEIPKAIYTTEAFSETPTGKVQRQKTLLQIIGA